MTVSTAELTLRPSQKGSLNKGDISSTLNLYRGEVDRSLVLASLPGRNGLDVSVSAHYSSGVAKEISLQNCDAPTSVVGVGWGLDIERVVLVDRGRGIAEQAAFALVSAAGVQALHPVGVAPAGGRIFQLADFRFWRILYFPDPVKPTSSHWVICREDGSKWVYGRTGAVETAVSWRGWVGPSVALGGQTFPVSWALSSIVSRQGDRISYKYAIDQTTIGGQSSSRSARLASVTDVYGRCVRLRYKLKDAFERELPHVPPAGSGAAFQFEYQQHYLDSVDVENERGDLMFRQKLEYSFMDLGGLRVGSNFKKRYLIGCSQETASGRTLAGVEIEYERGASAENPGAMTSFTYPAGAKISYEYGRVGIPLGRSDKTVQGQQDFEPSVWQGQDYVVITWYNPATQRLQLAAYSWIGAWYAWPDSKFGARVASGARVIAGGSYFALVFDDTTSGRRVVRQYHRESERVGHWAVAEQDLGPTSDDAITVGGNGFIAHQTPGQHTLWINQWDPLQRSWERYSVRTPDADHMAIAAGDQFVAGVFQKAGASNARIQIFFKNDALEWVAGDYADVNVTIDWSITRPETVWSLTNDQASATFITSVSGGTVHSSVAMVRWEDAYQLTGVQVFGLSQGTDVLNPILYSVTRGAVTGLAQTIFRFDPSNWNQDSLLTTQSGPEYRYAYGSDLAMAMIFQKGKQEFLAKRFDPYRQAWVSTGAPKTGPLGGGVGKFLPQIAGDIALLGREVFCRDSSNSWSSAMALPASINADSTRLGSGFVAYQEASAGWTEVITIENGSQGRSQRFNGEKIAVDESLPGTQLVGSYALVTYLGTDLKSSRRLVLRRISPSWVPEKAEARVVLRSSLHTEGIEYSAQVVYDSRSALPIPSGDGCRFAGVQLELRDASAGGSGATVSGFFNGAPPDLPGAAYPPDDPDSNVRSCYSMFEGQRHSIETKREDGVPVSGVRTWWWGFRDYPYGYSSASSTQNLWGVYARPKRIDRYTVRELDGRVSQTLVSDDRIGPAHQAACELKRRGLISDPDRVRARRLRGGSMEVRDPATRRQFFATRSCEGTVGISSLLVTLNCTERLEYNGAGQQSASELTSTRPDGTEERFRQELTYAWEVYDALLDEHDLGGVVEQRMLNTSSGEIIGIDVTTMWDRWASTGSSTLWGEHKSYAWAGQPGTDRFDFAAWSGLGEPPIGWIKTGEVTDRSPRGLVLEQRDIDRIPTSFILDDQGTFLVATLPGTSVLGEEGWYYGFEDYESPGPWHASRAGAQITTGAAYAGERRLELIGDAAAPPEYAATFTPNPASDALVLSCRYCTPDVASLDAEWRVLAEGAGLTAEIVYPLSPTGQRWSCFTAAFCAEDFGLPSIDKVTATARNAETGVTLLVDTLFFLPVGLEAHAWVYDSFMRLVIADVGALGSAEWTLYDDLARPVGSADHKGQPGVLSSTYSWRESGLTPSSDGPNATLTLTPRAGGTVANLPQGEGGLLDWVLKGDWTLERDSILFNPTSPTRTSLAPRDTPDEAVYAMRVSIGDDAGPTSSVFGFDTGRGVVFQNAGGAWSATLVDDTGIKPYETDAGVAPFDHARDLVLVVTPSLASVFDAGRLAITAPITRGTASSPSFFADDRLRVSGPVYIDGALVARGFTDEAARPMQQLSLAEDGVEVSESVRDGLGRPAVLTKTVRISGGLEYRPALITSMDWNTGQMTGVFANAYPEDHGYPYGRTRFDQTPDSKPIETGLPGQELAIDLTVPETNRLTSRNLYHACSPSDGSSGVVSPIYLQNTVIEQDGTRTSTMTDDLGRTVCTERAAPAPSSLVTKTSYEYDQAGRIAAVVQPNAFDMAIPASRSFRTGFEYDFLGRMISKTTPDASSTTEFVYDRAGRLRFAIDAVIAAEGLYEYTLYDRLGRQIESGLAAGVWDRQQLQTHADDPAWKPPGSEWNTRTVYGTTGDATGLGRVISTVTRAGGPGSVEITESFSYDTHGRVTLHETQPGAGAQKLRQFYEYDLTGSVQHRRLSVSGRTFRTSYSFDAAGRVNAIAEGEDPAQPVQLARFSHDANGNIDTVVLAPASSSPIQRVYRYTPAGWLKAVTNGLFTESLSYGPPSPTARAGATGRALQIESVFNGPNAPGFLNSFKEDIGYDGLGRLQSVANSFDPQFDIGVTDPITFDPNGNMLGLSRGGTPWVFDYSPGTNQLISTTSGTRTDTYSYDAGGGLIADPSRGIISIEREAMSRLVAEIQTHNDTLKYAYDRARNRVSEYGSRGHLLNAFSIDGHASARVDTGSGGITRLVWGPTGLLATRTDSETRYAMTDRLGSIRAVCDENAGIIGAFNYTPMGAQLGQAFVKTGVNLHCPFRFTGQLFEPVTGLYLFPSRLYDPSLGRFVSPDTMEQYPSPYIYSGDDWLNLTDPTGDWSGGSIASVLGGIAFVIAGGALIFFTAGAATPAVVGAGAVFGGALIGAGLGATIYGLSHTGDNFNWSEALMTTALGGLFGAISGGLSLATAGISSAGWAFAAEAAIGVGVGAADGVITNGVLNVMQGAAFGENACMAFALGASIGGVTGALGGLWGRGVAFHNSRILSEANQPGLLGNRSVIMARSGQASIRGRRPVESHTVVGVRNGNHRIGYEQVTLNNRTRTQVVTRPIRRANSVARDVADALQAGRSQTFELRMSNQRVGQMQNFAENWVRVTDNVPGPQYSRLTNSCATTGARILEATGLRVPPWARFWPPAQAFWFRQLSGATRI